MAASGPNFLYRASTHLQRAMFIPVFFSVDAKRRPVLD
jgi:hypothetical protein